MRWMDIAWQQIGEAAIAGAEANPRILDYFRDVGRPDIVSDEVAWCAAFVGYCLKEGGVSIDAIPRDKRLAARAYLDFGTPIDTPRPGALAVFSRGSDPESGHVGFVVGSSADNIVIIGGNQGAHGIVSTSHMPRARLVGLRWPAAVETGGEVAAKGSRIARAAARVQRDGVAGGGAQALPQPPKLPGPDAIVGKASALRGTVETVTEFASFASARWPLILGLVTAYFVARMVWDGVRIRGWRVEDHNTGANVQPAEPEGNHADAG